MHRIVYTHSEAKEYIKFAKKSARPISMVIKPAKALGSILNYLKALRSPYQFPSVGDTFQLSLSRMMAAMADTAANVDAHLGPSDLGTKAYWDNYYQNDLNNGESEGDDERELDPSDLESWFDDVAAPAKTLAFMTSESFPLSPKSKTGVNLHPSVLDVGTGNGSTLMSLRLDGGFRGLMVGVDYSEHSIQLARKLWSQSSKSAPNAFETISFEVMDVIRDDATTTSWWPSKNSGFDLVLDKGTFDAISLSSEIDGHIGGIERKVFETYPERIGALIKPGGFFLITSCNWTHDEVIWWFTTGSMKGTLEVYDNIEYPIYQFGGQKGQGVVSICFRKPGDS